MLQQALSGQGLRSEMAVPSVGATVPGTVGPHTAFVSVAGIGGVPELRQIILPIIKSLQPPHPQVPLL